jgi:O-antigen ligase
VPTVAPFGPFVSKNHFAGYVELGALLAVGLATGLADEARHGENWLSWIDSRRGKWIVVAWAAALVLVLAVPVSLSRGGVVSLAAGLACFALLRVLSRRRSRLSGSGLVGVLAALGAAGLLVVAVLPAEARQRMLTLAGITNDQSGSYRLALWGDTLRVVASSPVVGSGFGAYEDALPRFKTAAAGFRVQHAENDHLEFLAEGGLLAAGLGAAAVLALLFLGLGTLPATEHRLARSLLTAAFAAGATAFVHAVFDFNLHIPSNTLVASLVAALSVSATHRRAESATTSRRSPGSTMALLVLTGSFLCALVTPWADPWWEQSRLRRARTSGEADLRRASLETDVAGLLHRRPARAEAWVQLGWLRLLGSRVPDSAEDAKGLARWGVVLDPTHSLLGHAATPIGISVPPSYPR